MLAARGRPKATTPASQGRNATSAEEYKAIASGLLAQFGTWSLNGTAVTYHVDGALFPNIEGTEFTLTVSLSGDELRTTGTGQSSPTVWRRVKQ